jgi:ABC-type bacteriocin/lantibiotic exporter with double-glycine peptidase domain
VNVLATIAGLVAAFSITLQNSSSGGKTDPNCGPVCLGIAFAALKDTAPPALDSLVKSTRVQENGCSLADLERAATELGLQTVLAHASLESLAYRDASFACIALLNDSHFVLIKSIEPGLVTIIDGSKEFTAPVESFSTMWKGDCLLVSTEPLESETAIGRRMWWRQFMRNVGWGVACVVGIYVAVFLVRRVRERTRAT